MRPEVGIVEEEGIRQRIVPDIVVVRHSHPPQEPDDGGAAVLTRTRREISRCFEFEVRNEPIRHHFVEIRDSLRGHKLITLIEILSPSNKRAGPDREAYESQQREVLESDASLDRAGPAPRRPSHPASARTRGPGPEPETTALLPGAGQLVVAACPRSGRLPGLSGRPAQWLPCIPVPLKQGEDDVRLDLQVVFNRAYDTGPYRRGAVHYSAPPPPPALGDEDAVWAAERTRPCASPPRHEHDSNMIRPLSERGRDRRRRQVPRPGRACRLPVRAPGRGHHGRCGRLGLYVSLLPGVEAGFRASWPDHRYRRAPGRGRARPRVRR